MKDKTYIDQTGVIYSADRKALLEVSPGFACKDYHVAEGTVDIEDSAFWNCQTLERLWLPDSVSAGCACLCEAARNLRFARLSANVKHPCIAVFCRCESLEEIILPEGIEGIGENMFTGCISLRHIHLPSTITYLNGECFADSGLEEIDLPEGVTRIGDDAFAGCRSLRRLVIPKNVRHIGPWLVQGHKDFEGIVSLSPHFRVEDECLISNEDDALIACWTKSSVFHIPSSVRNIYSICNDLIETLIIDHPIEKVGYDALIGNPRLKEIVATAEIAEFEYSYNCEHIAGNPAKKQ
ncbi:MAG: leucine-rich repeat domain-containing protein [Muribaculaceae bacterium]|nr:leucine-rich repeat domain-containing protein [Muribaculaceae bacterium]